jgi:predicted CoA-substrate-specific enzyme activase
MHRLGLDLGTTAIKAVLLDRNKKPYWQRAVFYTGNPASALSSILSSVRQEVKGPALAFAATGRLRNLITARNPELQEVSDVAALAAGAHGLCRYLREAIVIGGHDTLFCRLSAETAGGWDDFAVSDLCAAGGGAFLSRQAERLCFTVEELGRAAAAAKRAPAVAGRCAVFTKTDIIHLQQKGTPVEEIALGLCYALIRTFQSQVLHGRVLEGPVLLAGGCARNLGIVRAVRELFSLSDEMLLIPEAPEMVSATGAALSAERPSALDDVCASLGQEIKSTRAVRAPLLEQKAMEAVVEPAGRCRESGPLILGVDVGSVSTNLALIDEDGSLLFALYLKTRGRPIDALKEGMAALLDGFPSPDIVGVATTGSGRILAGRFLGADLIRNEISAQLRAARDCRPDVDTVFEIGGQDAKYIRSENGRLVDFAMNRVCAAGTGSFLEEQAERLGINIIDEFSKAAFASHAPLDFGRRCTVFMESEMVSALADGATVNDAAAGLACSVVRNYLERVVGGRPIGKAVVFQGGTAANQAVAAAFSQLLKEPLTVHPFARVSGALGAALLLKDEREAGRLLKERGAFRRTAACEGVLTRSFECTHCSARCQVTRFLLNGEPVHFGDVCERYSTGDHGTCVPDPLARRVALLMEASDMETQKEIPQNAVGLLHASHTLALLPWFAALARAAGFTPYLAPATSAETLDAAAPKLKADTCLPIKAAFGQGALLLKAGVNRLFIPMVTALPGEERLSASCLFGHHLPGMMAGISDDVTIIAPPLSLDLPKGKQVIAPKDTGALLNLTNREMNRALKQGEIAYAAFRRKMITWGNSVMEMQGDRIAVVMGRPYLLSCPYLNMGVGRHLFRMGFPVIPMDALPIDTVALDEKWQDLPWRFARDLIAAAQLVNRDERLFPVVLSSFGCGPDAFVLGHLEQLFGSRPHLVLEMDEHRSEAGLLTRLEAFVDEVTTHIDAKQKSASRPPRPTPKLSQKGRLIMPHFADHVFGHAGLMRAAGYEVIALPPPDGAIREKGEAFTTGRECHPFAMVAGDLLNWIDSGNARQGDVYFYPGTVVSCLLRQYGDGLNLMLSRKGESRIPIVTPSLDSWIPLVGLSLTIRVQAVQVSGDALIRALCRIRPYEKHPGETDAVYRECLALLSKGAEEGTHFDILETCVEKMNSIPRYSESRPVVGVAGDVYTRINGFASDGLFERLEKAGLEVWPSPFGTDVAELNARRRRAESLRLRRYARGIRYTMAERIMKKQTRKIEAIFSRIEGLRKEPAVADLEALAAPYIGPDANPLMVLNVGRMLMYAAGGVSGILNAACINCMVGAASQAFEARLRKDLGNIPMTTLVYGGSDSFVNRTRLEAFVHQVRTVYRESH